jgi:hypothetical protein
MDYCTYAYLREDGTPYYVGKGKKYRPYSKNRLFKPPSKDRILILKTGLTEEEAIKHEIYMIAVLGRKDNNTGILRNLTDGGDGISGYSHTEEAKNRIREKNSNKPKTKETLDKIANSVKGFKWYNNGKESIQARSHPGDGWSEGRIWNWDSPRNKGMRWYHKSGIRKLFKEDPGDGWILGRLDIPTANNHTNKGKRWYNDGTINKMFVNPPEGWTPGMIKR